MQNLKFALRHLLKTPGFTAVAVITLAVGIGSAATMFGVLQSLVVDPFNYPQGDQLVQLWSNEGQPFSAPDFFDVKEQATGFGELGVYSPGRANLGGKDAQSIRSVSCTSGVLRAYGIAPALGRFFEPADEASGAPLTAIISYRLWQDTFAGDKTLLGRTIRLNSADVTVVGVMPDKYEFVSPWLRSATVEVWTPLQLKRGEGERDNHWLCAIGRLKDGVSPAVADAEIKGIGARLKAAYPDTNSQKPFLVRSLYIEMTSQIRSRVWMLFGVVILVLLVACSNVASMLLARNAGRYGEFGVRLALGASPGHILRIALSESLVIATAGAVLGLGFGYGGIRVFQLIAPLSEARKAAMMSDGRMLLFASVLVIITALLAGLPSAFASLRISVADLLRTDSRNSAGSQARHRLLRGLIITQVAIAFVMANGAALFSASYAKILSANSKLASEYVLSGEITLRGARYDKKEDRARFFDLLASRVSNLPGVTASGITSKLPLEGGVNMDFLVNNEVFDSTKERMIAEISAITPGYFSAAGISVLRGRSLRPDDAGEDNIGVVINRAMADKCWPGQDPLEKIIRPNSSNADFHARVIGVVESVRQWGPDTEPKPEIYWTPDRAYGQTIFLVVRSQQPASQLAPLLRHELAVLDTDLPLSRIRTLQTVVSDSTKGHRILTGFVDFFVVLSLGMVAVGLFGTLSYNIRQRTREIGVRVALGASRRDIMGLVLRQGTLWALIGVMIGIAGALAMTAALRAMVFGMNSIEPLPLLAATAAVLAAALLACWLPARRATKINPIEALRAD